MIAEISNKGYWLINNPQLFLGILHVVAFQVLEILIFVLGLICMCVSSEVHMQDFNVRTFFKLQQSNSQKSNSRVKLEKTFLMH